MALALTKIQAYSTVYLSSLWPLQHHYWLPHDSKLPTHIPLCCRLFPFMKRQLLELWLFPFMKRQ